ncbi:MAG: hypothetical protein ACAI43_21800 [Phycisphaerae bacterium]|nr:hypothetical protein [Tepidisphaeraceae bacterium]
MSSINPFSGYVAAGSQVERAHAAEKAAQVRRTQAMSRNVAARDDEMEHQVESVDVVGAVKDDEAGKGQERPKQRGRGGTGKQDTDQHPTLDVRA